MGENSSNLVTLNPWQPDQSTTSSIVDCQHRRMTRLGEFSPDGWLFNLLSFFENYWSSPHFLAIFPQLRLCINFGKKGLGYLHFGRFFNKLIWSPCRHARTDSLWRGQCCAHVTALTKKLLANFPGSKALKAYHNSGCLLNSANSLSAKNPRMSFRLMKTR
jgi:hypothetical protein